MDVGKVIGLPVKGAANKSCSLNRGSDAKATCPSSKRHDGEILEHGGMTFESKEIDRSGLKDCMLKQSPLAVQSYWSRHYHYLSVIPFHLVRGGSRR